MAIYKAQEAPALEGKVREGALRGVLVHGNDPGGVAELSARLVRAAVGGEDDPLSIVVMDEETCREDPARLTDEVQAISMFGSRRVVRVRGAGEAFFKAMENALQHPPAETVVIAEAGSLKPASKLRKLFEKHGELAAVAIYEDDARDIRRIVTETLAAHGLSASAEAQGLLCELLGADRGASRAELEKLALYCHGAKRVEAEDVRAICGDVSAHAMNDMIDAFFLGDAARGCGLFASLMAEGVAPAGVLAAASSHVARLRQLALQVAAGEAPAQVVRQARPPIFFRRRQAMTRQLGLWAPPALAEIDESLFEATAQSRANPGLDAQIAERCLLSLAVRARRAARR